MYNDFTKHILQVCKSLNECNVRFIIVGGTASGFHGFYRLTVDDNGLPTEKHDFDFWFEPTYENYFNILKAMKSLGKDTSKLQAESTPNPKKSFLKFDFQEFKIDFLPEIKGLNTFNNSYSNASHSIVDSVQFNILSLEFEMEQIDHVAFCAAFGIEQPSFVQKEKIELERACYIGGDDSVGNFTDIYNRASCFLSKPDHSIQWFSD